MHPRAMQAQVIGLLTSPLAKLTVAVVQERGPCGVPTEQWHLWGQQAWVQHPQKENTQALRAGLMLKRLLPKGGTGCSPALSLAVDIVHLSLTIFQL